MREDLLSTLRAQHGRFALVLRSEHEFVPFVDGLSLVLLRLEIRRFQPDSVRGPIHDRFGQGVPLAVWYNEDSMISQDQVYSKVILTVSSLYPSIPDSDLISFCHMIDNMMNLVPR